MFQNKTKNLITISTTLFYTIMLLFSLLNNISIGYIVTTLLLLVSDFIQLGGFEYIKNIPDGIPAINITVLVKYFAVILFYLGIFILTADKKEKGL